MNKHSPSISFIAKYKDDYYIVLRRSNNQALMDSSNDAYIFKLTIKPTVSFNFVYEIGGSSKYLYGKYFVWYLIENKMMFLGVANSTPNKFLLKGLNLDTLEAIEEIELDNLIPSRNASSLVDTVEAFIPFAPAVVKRNNEFSFFFEQAVVSVVTLNSNLTETVSNKSVMAFTSLDGKKVDVLKYCGEDVISSRVNLAANGKLINNKVLLFYDSTPSSGIDTYRYFVSRSTQIRYAMFDYITEVIDRDPRWYIPSDISKMSMMMTIDPETNEIFLNYCHFHSDGAYDLSANTYCVIRNQFVYSPTTGVNFLYYFRTDQLKLPYKKDHYIRVNSPLSIASPAD